MLSRSRHRRCRVGGFTLIELVMIIVAVSILGVAMLTRYHDPVETAVSVEADRLGRDLRHVQMLAMTWGQTLRLTPAGGGYSVSCVTPSATPPCNVSPVNDPAVTDATGNPAFTRTLETGITVAGAALDIDALGRPVSGGALLNADTAYTLTGGSQSSTVTVARLTGFVSVVY